MSLISSKRNFLSELVSATLRSGFFVTICDPSETGRVSGAGDEPSGRKTAESLPDGARFPGFETVFGTDRQL